MCVWGGAVGRGVTPLLFAWKNTYIIFRIHDTYTLCTAAASCVCGLCLCLCLCLDVSSLSLGERQSTSAPFGISSGRKKSEAGVGFTDRGKGQHTTHNTHTRGSWFLFSFFCLPFSKNKKEYCKQKEERQTKKNATKNETSVARETKRKNSCCVSSVARETKEKQIPAVCLLLYCYSS